MRSSALTLKSVRKNAYRYTESIGDSAKKFAKSVKKSFAKIDWEGMGKETKKQVNFLSKRGQRLILQAKKSVRLTARKLRRKAWYREFKRGVFFPKRARILRNLAILNGRYLQLLINQKIRRVNNSFTSDYPALRNFADDTLAITKFFFGTQIPRYTGLALERVR
ncbi:hypothetical protein [Sporocytophaga myxococcoides]|uniref:hypothetical protein n=1 Tax=Sporocytophaga myxococcoides TaxID=153721 RepID=UPI00041616A0|nr:hypothetical protein [Sporocytophaga myxococcoides]